MIKKIFAIALVVTLLASASSVKAAVTSLYWTPVDGDPTIANSVQNTLYTSTSVDWTNAVLSVFLTEGSLLNPFSTGDPTQEWRAFGGVNDSWLAVPSNANGGTPTINLFDQDSPLVPGVDHTFDWFDTADTGAVLNGIAARIYASDNAKGTFSVQMFDRQSAGVGTQLTGFISNGAFVPVPEPATLTLVGLTTAAGLLTLRRRRAS